MDLHVVFNKCSPVLWSFLESGEVMGYSRKDENTWLHLLKTTWRSILERNLLFLLGFDFSSTVAALCHHIGAALMSKLCLLWRRDWSLRTILSTLTWGNLFEAFESSGSSELRAVGLPTALSQAVPFGQLTIRADGFYCHLCDRLAFLCVKYLGPKMFWILPPTQFWNIWYT